MKKRVPLLIFSLVFAAVSNISYAGLSDSFYKNLLQCKTHYEYDKESATSVKISGMENGTCTITYQSHYVCHYNRAKIDELLNTQNSPGSFFPILMDHMRDPSVCYTIIDGKKVPYGE